MHVHWNMKPENVDIRKDKVYYVPETAPEDGRLHFLRYGVYLGDLKKKRFEPSQPFALALAKELYDQTIDLPEDDERLERYMRGETLLVKDVVEKSAKEGRPMKNGWYLILASGYPLGFGKLSGEILKNKYPAGWRKNN